MYIIYNIYIYIYIYIYIFEHTSRDQDKPTWQSNDIKINKTQIMPADKHRRKLHRYFC